MSYVARLTVVSPNVEQFTRAGIVPDYEAIT
jgi:hypothetical protein